MDSRHSTLIHISSVTVHYQNVDKRTLSHLPYLMLWQILQYAHILSLIMHFLTGNVYCGAVLSVIVSIFLTKKFQINMTKLHPQLGFTFITSLDVVLLMVDFH